MSLFANPIFLTQRRLVHRAGVMAAILFAAVIGLSFVAGLVAYMTGASYFDYLSVADAGKAFFGWTLALEFIVLPIIGTSRIARALADDRKSGLWDSNRLTPLTPAQLVMGYWLGAPLREVYATAVFAACGLVIVVLSGLPLTLWLGSQVLVLSTALLFGLLAMLTTLSLQRSEGGLLMFLGIIVVLPFSMFESSRLITSYILPVAPLAHLFDQGNNSDMAGAPSFFAMPLPAMVIGLILQGIVGTFFWRTATRKTAQPFGPLFTRRQAIGLFGVLALAQHGLIWEIWAGGFPIRLTGHTYDSQEIMTMVHCGTLFFGLILLVMSSPTPERILLASLRARDARKVGWGLALANSAVPEALAFTVLAGIFLFTQFTTLISEATSNAPANWAIYGIAVANLLNFFLIVALLLEWCRMRLRRGGPGFFGLGLFILTVLPFILGGVFSDGTFGHFSLLSPGVLVLTDYEEVSLSSLALIDGIHFVIAVGLFLLWRHEWKQMLKLAAPRGEPPVLGGTLAAGTPAAR